MKTKEEGWVKAAFDVKLAYEETPKHIENGRQYKFFGVDMSYKYREVYHVPTGTRIGMYELTLQEIKEMVDRLLEVDINWSSSDLLYFPNLDEETMKKINKILMNKKVG